MDSFFTESTQTKTEQIHQERRRVARNLYDYYAQTNKNLNCHSPPLPAQNNSLKKSDSAKNQVPISEEDSLLLLEALSQGKTIPQIHGEYQIFRRFDRKKLHNLRRCTIGKLCKTFVEVLPKNICQLTTQKFQQTYFKTAALLTHYTQNGINLPELFHNLVFIRSWQKNYKGYLERGYGSDYLPESVVSLLEALPQYYQNIRYVYELSHASTSDKKLPIESPTSYGSSRRMSTIEADFSE